MTDVQRDYWLEAVCQGAYEAYVSLTSEEACTIADYVQSAHEHYSYSFYSPPDSEYYDAQERKHASSMKSAEEGFKKERAYYEERIENLIYEIRRLENIIYDLRSEK